jgi:hypothetical protein
MKNTTNEEPDQPLTFAQLGLPTALIMNRIRNLQAMQALVNVDNQKEKTCHCYPDACDADEQRLQNELANLDRRLAALRRWRGE